MCYMVIVSTTSQADLTALNTPLVQFSRNVNAIPEAALLSYPNKWFLGSKDGCSCAFRHLDQNATDLGFSEPVDWWEEGQEDIDATLQVVEAFHMILRGGHKLDCIDAWTTDSKELKKLAGDLVVDLNKVGAKRFRFFEGYRFELEART